MEIQHKRNSLGYLIGRKASSSGPEIVWGRAADGSRLHIDDATSGSIDMAQCECGELLVAKKGDQLAHHFAHASGSRTVCKRARIGAVTHFVADAILRGPVRLPILNDAFRYVAFGRAEGDGNDGHIVIRGFLDQEHSRSVSIFLKMTPRQPLPSAEEAEERGDSAFTIDLASYRNGTDDLLHAAILRTADRSWIVNKVRPSAVQDEARWRKGIPSYIRQQLPKRPEATSQWSISPGSRPARSSALISEEEWNTLSPRELRLRLFGNKYDR